MLFKRSDKIKEFDFCDPIASGRDNYKLGFYGYVTRGNDAGLLAHVHIDEGQEPLVFVRA